MITAFTVHIDIYNMGTLKYLDKHHQLDPENVSTIGTYVPTYLNDDSAEHSGGVTGISAKRVFLSLSSVFFFVHFCQVLWYTPPPIPYMVPSR